jgi:hypothetical protein
VTHENHELGPRGPSFARATQQLGISIGEVALEGLWRVALSAGARQASGFGLGTGQDGGAHVRLQGEVDVDHAEVVRIAARAAASRWRCARSLCCSASSLVFLAFSLSTLKDSL